MLAVETSAELSNMRAPLRNLLLTLALTLSALAVTGALWGTAGYEMLIVAMGWPHILLGFAFFWGKVCRNAPHARAQFVFLSAVTLAWWLGHYAFGLAALIYVYFLYHAFRDEIFVYLTTRAQHRGQPPNVYARAGIVPLLLLLLAISQPQDYRQDVRRVATTVAHTQADGWTLFQFRPIADSRGHEFYFYLQAPHTAGQQGLTLQGLANLATRDANTTQTPYGAASGVLVNDYTWPDATMLAFAPYYAGTSQTQPLGFESVTSQAFGPVVPVGVLGGHRVGQTFVAQQDNLAGIWLRTNRTDAAPADTQLLLRVASPALLPMSETWARVRWACLTLAAAWLIWQVWRNWRVTKDLWLYLALFGVVLIALQNGLKAASNAGYAVPMIFQLVVTLHYFSWYVFTFDKMRVRRTPQPEPSIVRGWDKVLQYLRAPRSFAAVVVGLSVLSVGGVAWYYSGVGPAGLRYGFDYSYFLYFLVFHVTFSFAPRLGRAAGNVS